MKRFPWLELAKKSGPEVPYEPPILLGNKSNGEFFHEQTPLERRMRGEILRQCDEGARKHGMDRREFAASLMGMATSLSVLNLASGCSGDDDGYQVPDEAKNDCDAAHAALSGDEFIFDLQTHHVESEERWRAGHPDGTYAGNAFANAIVLYPCSPKASTCIDEQAYYRLIFLESQTTVATLSGFPSPICDEASMCNSLISNEAMARARDEINAASKSQRVVQHCQVAPNDRWELQAQMMERIHSEYGNRGFKCYPPWGPSGKGWRMDDEAVAFPFYQKAIELGEPLICAHKGFLFPGWDAEGADPSDVGPAALAFPEVNFVIYHSAFDTAKLVEGPYDAANAMGVDRLCKTVDENGLKGKNVFAEMGSAWALSMGNAEAAQHYVGKLLKYVGEDNVLWGSECTWFGSPQPQIEAFRALQISKQFQDTYGYPELTPAIKAKILGLNGARIYRIDPKAVRCALDANELALQKRHLDAELGDRRWAFQKPLGPRTRREFLAFARWRRSQNTPA
jgi:uncharacterized protein